MMTQRPNSLKRWKPKKCTIYIYISTYQSKTRAFGLHPGWPSWQLFETPQELESNHVSKRHRGIWSMSSNLLFKRAPNAASAILFYLSDAQSCNVQTGRGSKCPDSSVIFALLLVEFTLFLSGCILVLLVLRDPIIHVGLSLSELHLIHTLTGVPVQEGLAAEPRTNRILLWKCHQSHRLLVWNETRERA